MTTVEASTDWPRNEVSAQRHCADDRVTYRCGVHRCGGRGATGDALAVPGFAQAAAAAAREDLRESPPRDSVRPPDNRRWPRCRSRRACPWGCAAGNGQSVGDHVLRGAGGDRGGGGCADVQRRQVLRRAKVGRAIGIDGGGRAGIAVEVQRSGGHGPSRRRAVGLSTADGQRARTGFFHGVVGRDGHGR